MIGVRIFTAATDRTDTTPFCQFRQFVGKVCAGKNPGALG